MYFLLAGLAIVFVDQAAKWLVRQFIFPGDALTVIPGLLQFTHVRNPGAAFGLFPNSTLFLALTTIAVLILVTAQSRRLRNQNAWVKWGLALGLGGAVGNLIDRLRDGLVTDFIDFRFFRPVFNLADTFIVVGVAILFWQVVWAPGKSPEGQDVKES